MTIQGTQDSQNNLEKEQARKLMLPDFKTYYTTVIKAAWHRQAQTYGSME